MHYYTFKNLAGRANVDEAIKEELLFCNISPRGENAPYGEVNTNVSGTLNGFTFRRAWSYWIVSGRMPLYKAIELNSMSKDYKEYIRVRGHAGGLSNEDVQKASTYYHKESGIQLIPQTEVDKYNDPNSMIWHSIAESIASGEYVVSDDFERDGNPFINTYHIDTWRGLRGFSDFIVGRGIWNSTQM